jgi:hypothetical protein
VASLLGELVFLPALLLYLGRSRKQAVPTPAPQALAVESNDDGPEFRSLPLRPHFQTKVRSRKIRH